MIRPLTIDNTSVSLDEALSDFLVGLPQMKVDWVDVHLIFVYEVLLVELPLVLLVVLHLFICIQEVGLLLWNMPQILRNCDVDCLQGLLDVAFDHVYVLSYLVLECLVDLEQVHLDSSHVLVRLGLVLLHDPLLDLDLLTLIDDLDEQSHPHAVEHQHVV